MVKIRPTKMPGDDAYQVPSSLLSSDSMRKSPWISVRLLPVLSFATIAENRAISQHIAAESHMTFAPPRVTTISSKVKVAISEISHPRATAAETTGVFSCSGSVSPNRDHEIGPRPRLNEAKNRLIHVGGIHE